ncbi:hypothetical protein SLE2022_008060 [Rubroshorea leprosula]
MCLAWLKLLKYEIPTKHFEGNSFKTFYFGRFGSVLAVTLFLGFVLCGFCAEFPMVSVPLGFKISSFDRSRTWVSQNGIFAFGFFEGCRKVDNFDGFVVGVRYNLGDKDANLPVWTVGGGLRVSENSTVRLSLDGKLILFDNSSGLIVWSSNTSGLGVKKATLLDNGNLVLMGGGDIVLWSSFSSPTSTLLPGQSLHFPQTLRAPSTKSISSYYSFVIRSTGELALLWEGNVTYWRTHLGSDAIVREARFDFSGALSLIDRDNRTVWSIRSEDYGDPSVSLRHLRIDSDGNLRIYSWDSLPQSWRVRWQAVENQCEVFGSCGLYSLCSFNSTGPVCDCLYQDSVTWGAALSIMGSSASGCRKMVDLGNCKMKATVLTLKRTVLYGLYPPEDIDMMLSQEACKEYCSNDTTCIAATSKNDGSGVCTIKRTSFISGYRSPSVPSFSFLKVCLVPQAVSDMGANHFNSSRPVALVSKGLGTKKVIGAITLIVLVTGMGFFALEMLVFLYIYQRGKVKVKARIPFGKDTQMNSHYSSLIRLSFEEIKELTGNFSNQLGPSIYKGAFPYKIPFIAKVLDTVVTAEKNFRVAVSTLGGMHHRNLVPLKGFCFEAKLKCLVYEYVPNGSLDEWLDNMNQNSNGGNWKQKLDIALGVAQALAYLHTECQECVAHGNLKLANVLLDEKFIPKVTDYGLGKFLEEEPASSSQNPPERDIYMLGEMLLQILTGKKDVLCCNLHCLVTMTNEELKLEDCHEAETVERAVRIALWCMQKQPFLRPSIGEVVKVLEGSLSVDRPPSTFAFRQDQQH